LAERVDRRTDLTWRREEQRKNPGRPRAALSLPWASGSADCAGDYRFSSGAVESGSMPPLSLSADGSYARRRMPHRARLGPTGGGSRFSLGRSGGSCRATGAGVRRLRWR
jgi:hypothetical protein